MTRQLRCALSRLAAGLCFLLLVPALAQEAVERVPPASNLLQERIRAAQESDEVDQATKDRLIELQKQSLADIEAARANQQATEAFQRALRDAPNEAAAILEALERKRATDPIADVQITPATPPDQLEERLDVELANRTAIEAKLSTLDAALEEQTQRTTPARERIAALRVLVEEIEQQPDVVPDPDEPPLLTEARRWSQASRLDALQTEITMLEQELTSQSARVQLLKAQRDDAALTLERVGRRVEVLQSSLDVRRRDEAKQALDQATAVLDSASEAPPAVRDLAKANVQLVETLSTQVDELQVLTEQERRARPQTARLAEAYRLARRKLQLAGTRAPLGAAIREQRRQLPDANEYARARRVVGQTVVAASLRLVDNEDERRAMNDVETYVARRLERAGAAPVAAVPSAALSALIDTRRELLDRLIANDVAQIRRLYDLDDVLRQLLEKTKAYDDFLAERLLWVRSSEAIKVADFGTLRGEIAAYASPADWIDTAGVATEGGWRIPAIVLAIVIAALLVLLRKKLRAALAERGRFVGSVRKDSMRSTFEALLLTLLLALPGPLVLGVAGWAMITAEDATDFSTAVATALLGTANILMLIVSFRELYEPDGVAERHFGWSRATLARLRRQLAWFVVLALPLYFLTVSVVRMRPDTSGGTLGLLAFVGVQACLVGLFIGVGHPTRGTIGNFLSHNTGGWWWRWRYVWFSLGVAIPITLAVLALVGYEQTAGGLGRRVAQSIWLLAGLWIGRALVRRWLLMTGRRLAYEAAVAALAAAREAQAASAESGAEEVTEPQVDLVALDIDSRKVLNAAVALVALLGLVGIWGQMIPALGVLHEVDLWTKTTVTAGVEGLVPVTLADVLLALLIGLGGWIAAKNLPSLIDIILIKQGTVTAGARYAISTLSRYAIATGAALLVLGLLGASWSQMGWAVAALSVGIGFGLQEIVANFICGLILLFERPVCVGDVVTVGDSSGTVTRIRIRATTIREFDRKELIVPNKELITGRLLNWTLSDAMTRVSIKVGVAYGTNVDRAMAILNEVAAENERVLGDPAPIVRFTQFGDSSLDLSLLVHVATLADRGPTTTELHNAIDRKFREAGVEIPFPQRDVHMLARGATPHAPDDEPANRERRVNA